ncbi:MAG TPA: AI-2E family transporter, partial [Thermoanaerobaculia bacterium]|nr:AI-2E family transporter [Thermoanaerobaculia bacterium]
SSMRDRIALQLREHAGTLFPFFMTTVTAVAGVLLVLFLVIYLAADPSLYRDGMLRLLPRDRRQRAAEVGDEVASTLLRWLGAQGVSMLVIGAITTVALLLLDVKAAVALGILAGVSEFIPVFGPILSAIPAIGIAFVDSPTKALYVLIAYVAIQQVESNIVAPLIMKRGVDVPPVVTILAGTIMTILFGFLGLLVAVPVAAAILTIAQELTPPLEPGEEEG